jgi:hypothetical protein
MLTIRRASLFLFLLFSTVFAIANATSLAELSHRLAVANLMFNATGAPANQPTSSIQFSAPEYFVGEADGSVTITVNRIGDPSTAISVSYSTSDTAFANQKSDYTMASGTLNFAPGETTKNFRVLIIDDVYPQGDHVFSLRLSDPTGAASLGDTSLAGVIITDNDNTSPTLTRNSLPTRRTVSRSHHFWIHGRPWSRRIRYSKSLRFQMRECSSSTINHKRRTMRSRHLLTKWVRR